MKPIAIFCIVMINYVTVCAQHSLEKIWETDSVTLKNPESVLYDSLTNSLYVSCMGAAKIVRIGTDGATITNDWVTGLSSNKGLALHNGLLYVAETKTVAVIDVSKATVVKRIPVEDAIMLNDMAVDAKGIFYTTDTRAGKVYKIEDDKATLYLENLPGANGLLTMNTDLYVLTSTSVEKVSAQKVITKIADGFESGLDGIVPVAANEFILSNYKGILYYLHAVGTKQILQDTRAQGMMCNDIGYNPKTKTLYVPAYNKSQVMAFSVK